MATSFDFGGLLSSALGGTSALDDLLTPEQRAAIRQQGALSAAAALLQAAGPSPTRTSLGQALGSAFAAGQTGLQKGQEAALTQMLTRQKLEEAKRGQTLQANIARILAGGPAAAAPAPAATGEVTPEEALAAPGMAAGPTMERAALVGQPRAAAPAAQMAPNEMRAQQYRQVADVYAAAGRGEDAARYMDIAEKLAPTRQKVQGQPFEVTDAQGKPVLVQQFEDGTLRTLPGFGPRREVVLQTVDGRVMAIDKSKLAGGETYGTGRDVRPVDVGGQIRLVDFSTVAPGTTLSKTLAPQVVGGGETGYYVLGGGGGGAAGGRTAPAAGAAPAGAPAAAPAAAGPGAAAAPRAGAVAPAAAPAAGPQPIIPGTGKVFQNEKDMRAEFTTAMKPYVELSQAFQKIESAAKNPSGAGDISLVYGYMKILDPGSVVREGEFATAANAGGVPDAVRNIYNRAINGQRLGENVRADFLSQARNLIESQRELSNDVIDRYKNLASQYKLNPDAIVFDPFKRVKKPEEIIRGATPAAPAAPARPAGNSFFERFNLIPR